MKEINHTEIHRVPCSPVEPYTDGIYTYFRARRHTFLLLPLWSPPIWLLKFNVKIFFFKFNVKFLRIEELTAP